MTGETTPLFGKPERLFKPGSALWLMRHHIRTRLRGKNQATLVQKVVRTILLTVFFVLFCFMVGGQLAITLAPLNPNNLPPKMLLKAGVVLAAFFISMFGSSLISAYSLFTDRDDLDLLLSSPLPPHRILLSRLLQTAYGAMFTATLLGTMAFGISIVTVDIRYALIYPVILSFMLIALAISFVAARSLLHGFGQKTGRKIAMTLGYAILMIGVLTWQLNSFVGTSFGDQWLNDKFGPDFKGHLTVVLTPFGKLAFGHFVETLMLLVGAIGFFFSVGAFVWDRFGDDAALMAGQADQNLKPVKGKKVKFNTNIFTATIFKEWRSMSRDPYVLVQVATPLVTLIPLAIALESVGKSEEVFGIPIVTAFLGFAAVTFGGNIAATLAWTAASIEEAGDLLLSSPTDGPKLFWSKVIASAIPSILFLLVAMAWVAHDKPTGAVLGFVVGAIGLTCAGAVEFFRPRPARRMKMTQRQDRSILSIGLSFTFSMVWAVATAMAIGGLGFWTLIPIAIGCVAMIFIWLTAPKSIVWMAKAPKVGAAGGPWKA